MSTKIKCGEHILTQSELTGKMKMIPSLSTSPITNPSCIKNRKIGVGVCIKCFAVSGVIRFPSLGVSLIRNSEILKNKIDVSNYKTNTIYFRFESHGDLINENHLKNLVEIAENNPQTKFALWTKNYKLAEAFFDANHRPKNLQLIYSSLVLNKPLKKSKFRHPDKIFTVYTKGTKQKINCGANDCFTCGLCYNNNEVIHISELLK